MAPALILTLIMLATAAVHSFPLQEQQQQQQQQQNEQCTTLPPELIGVWVGPDQWLDDDFSVGLCEPAHAAFKESCKYTWLESCGDGEFSVEDAFLYSITSYRCTGPGEGYLRDVDLANGLVSCNYFKRSGNSLTYMYGHKAEDVKDIVCPDITSVIGESETIAGLLVGDLSTRESLPIRPTLLAN